MTFEGQDRLNLCRPPDADDEGVEPGTMRGQVLALYRKLDEAIAKAKQGGPRAMPVIRVLEEERAAIATGAWLD